MRAKISILAIASLVFAIAGAVVGVIAAIFATYAQMKELFSSAVTPLLMLSLLLGIFASVHIELSRGRLRGKGIAAAGIVITVLCFVAEFLVIGMGVWFVRR